MTIARGRQALGLSRVRGRHSRADTAQETLGRGHVLAYLSLHRTVEGQGGHTHIAEIRRGLERLGWRVDSFLPPPAGGLLGRLAQFIAPQIALMARIRRYDAVYIRHHPFALPVGLYAKWRGIPRVDEINGTMDDWYGIYPWSRRASRVLDGLSSWSLRTADSVVAVSEGLATWAASTGASGKVTVIANAADPEVYRPSVRSATPSQPYVVYAGALTPWEGVEVLLEAVASQHWPAGVDAVIAGGGPLEDRVREVARSCPHLHVLGRIPRNEVPDLISGSLAAVSTFSKPPYGASPIKLYEAMSCGVPVIASDSPGQAEIVNEERCGLVFAAGDSEGLCLAAQQLIADPSMIREMGERGRRAVLKRHSWSVRSERTSHLLTELASRRLVAKSRVPRRSLREEPAPNLRSPLPSADEMESQ